MGPYINRCLTGPGAAGECKVVNFPVSGFVFGEFSVGADLRNGQSGRFIVRRARFAVGPEGAATARSGNSKPGNFGSKVEIVGGQRG